MRVSAYLAVPLIGGVLGLATLASAQTSVPEAYRDCASVCPEMIVIPPGSFSMGSPASEQGRSDDEGPQHPVTINYTFTIGKYDVTQDEYAEFVSETHRPEPASCITQDASGQWDDTKGHNWHDPGFPQTGRDPVVCVSWDDAQAYVQWLSKKTGKRYRLLSESEWEYAARARTTTPYWWGQTANRDYANYGADQCCSGLGLASGHDQWVNTSPVGSFPANAFGLYDMGGNVWQWLDDCWNKSYSGAPMDGSPRHSGSCDLRVQRGGSWVNYPGLIRAASRDGGSTASRSSTSGFRVAKTL